MTGTLWKGIGLILCLLPVILLIKPLRGEWSIPVSLAGVLGLSFLLLPVLAELTEKIRGLLSAASWSEECGILLKSLGIALIAQLGGDICRDAGETALARGIETLGKAELLALALPLAIRITGLAAAIASGS